MLAADYKSTVEASPPKVQELEWITEAGRMYPNHVECLLNVKKNRPVSVSLKS